MYDEIQKIIVPHTLSSFDFTKLEELKKTYTEEQILDTYREVGYKPMQYIIKVLSTKKKIATDWLKQEITNEPIDAETEKLFKDFNDFLEEFRNEKEVKEFEDEN